MFFFEYVKIMRELKNAIDKMGNKDKKKNIPHLLRVQKQKIKKHVIFVESCITIH